MEEPSDKFPNIESVPSIAKSISDDPSLSALKEYIPHLNATQRQAFLEALQGAGRYFKLENERLDLKVVLENIGIAGAGAIASYLLLLVLFPPAASLGAAALGGSGVGSGLLLGDRLKTRRMIARLRQLRDAVVDAGRKSRATQPPRPE